MKTSNQFITTLILKRALSIVLAITLLAASTPAAPLTIKAVATEWHMSLGLWLRRNDLPAMLLQMFRGDGPKSQEKQETRDARVSELKIYPGDVTIRISETVSFSAVAYDTNEAPVGGVKFKWSARDEGRNRLARISQQGDFEAYAPGTYKITVEGAGKSEHVKVTVLNVNTKPNKGEKPLNVHPVSTRDLPGVVSLRRSRRDPKRRSAHAMSTRTKAAPALLPIEDWGNDNYWSADDPGNRRGDPPGAPQDDGAGSSNFQFASPVLNLPGRGINIKLNLTYNSRLWNKAGSVVNFDLDRDWPAPGWSLGFGRVVGMGDAGGSLIIDADGTRHAFRGTITNYGSSQYFAGHTVDGTFIDYSSWRSNGALTSAEVNFPNGMNIQYYCQGPGGVFPTQIRDANGNYLRLTYVNNTGPRIQTITDTLQRVITFHYDSNNLLTAITAPGLTSGTRTLVRLHYRQLNLAQYANFGFGGVTAVARDSNPWVIDAIYFPGTNAGFWFGDSAGTGYQFGATDSYSSYGMLAKVVEVRGMSFSGPDPVPPSQGPTAQGTITVAGQFTKKDLYNYPLFPGDPTGTPSSNLTDAPTFTSMTQTWTRDGTATNIESATTNYLIQENATNPAQPTVPSRKSEVTQPNGTKSIQYSYNYTNLADTNPLKALDGIAYQDETRDSAGVLLQSSVGTWQAGAYDTARPTRMDNTNEKGQTKATTIAYGSVYNQVTNVSVLDYDGTTVLHSTSTQYPNSANYTSRHIFSLPSVIEIFGPNNTRVSRTEYEYDGQTLTARPNVVQHDQAYNPYAADEGFCFSQPDWSDPDCYGGCIPELVNCDGFCPEVYYCPYDSSTDYRGNVTQIKTFANVDNASATAPITETRRYDITGNVVTASTACCAAQSSFNYTIDTQFGYAQSQTRGSATDQYAQVTTSSTYDFNTGAVLSTTDANGRVSQTIYDPVTLRPTTVLMVGGGHTDYNYDDAGLSVTETTYLSAHPTDTGMADQKIKLLNGIAQIRQEKAFTKNTQGQDAWDVVDTAFDNMGRISQQSRPYRLGVEQPKFSIAVYDALSRPTKVIAPDYTQPDGSDGSALQTFYNEPASKQPSAASGQSGETCRVVDAWGRERWTRKDARGRLVELVEPNPAGNGALATTENGLNPVLDLVTTYTYDAQNNLISVNQGGQTRSFKYDSLGRMTAQKLAEANATLNDAGVYQSSGGTWSDVFTYDDRSNITSRTDARGVKTNFNYNSDPLNRIQSVSFDTTGDPNHNLQPSDPNYYLRVLDAPTVTYQYRTKGSPTELKDVTQLASVTTAGVSTKSYTYDSQGRVIKRTLTLNSRSSYPMIMDYEFDTLDRITHTYYPGKDLFNNTGRKHLEPSYDLSSRVSGLTVDGQSQASEFVYNAASQTTQLKVGVSGPNQVIENYNYDPQTGLLGSQTLARSSAPTTWLLNLSYDYTGANGRRTGQLTKLLNNLNHNKDRNYTYDALGRLTQAKGGPTGTLWSQTYTYDRFGNRTSVSATGSSAKLSSQPNSQLALHGNQIDLPDPLRTDVPRSLSDSSLNLGSRPASADPAPVAPPQGPPVFTDDPLVPGVTPIRAVHITELRNAINQARTRAGLPAASWAEAVTTGTTVKAAHILEMRTKLDEARAALGLAPASYSSGLAAGLNIQAVHVQELRQFVTQALGSLPISPDGHTSLSYSAVTNRITTAGFEYDAAGNQTKVVRIGGAVQKYQYDAANRLVTIRDNNGVTKATYTYGHDNQRLITDESGNRTYYAAEGGAVMAEYVEVGGGTTPTWSKSYIYLGSRLLSTTVPGGAPNTESVQYHHPDRLGTRVVTSVNSGGTPTSFEQVTMPFGTAFNSESTDWTNRRFTTYDRSLTTGLDYAANRHYDSEQGRFTQVDPLGMKATNLEYSQSLNLYSYCLNDPINHTDPSGLGFLSFFKKLFRFLLKVLIIVALVVAVVYLGFLAAGLIVKAIGAGSLLAGILWGAAAFGVILGAMFVGGMAFGMYYTTILDAIKRCRVPNFAGLSSRRQDELTRLGVTAEQWNNLPNKSRLAYFNITSAIAAAGLSLEGWKVDWAAGGIQRDRVFFIAGPGASDLVAQVRATGRFNHGTNPRSEHKDYTDSWRGGFHPSLQLSFTPEGTRLDADLDSFNPSRGLFGLLFHLAEVSAHWIGGKTFGSKFTNPLAVGSRSNWECS